MGGYRCGYNGYNRCNDNIRSLRTPFAFAVPVNPNTQVVAAPTVPVNQVVAAQPVRVETVKPTQVITAEPQFPLVSQNMFTSDGCTEQVMRYDLTRSQAPSVRRQAASVQTFTIPSSEVTILQNRHTIDVDLDGPHVNIQEKPATFSTGPQHKVVVNQGKPNLSVGCANGGCATKQVTARVNGKVNKQ